MALEENLILKFLDDDGDELNENFEDYESSLFEESRVSFNSVIEIESFCDDLRRQWLICSDNLDIIYDTSLSQQEEISDLISSFDDLEIRVGSLTTIQYALFPLIEISRALHSIGYFDHQEYEQINSVPSNFEKVCKDVNNALKTCDQEQKKQMSGKILKRADHNPLISRIIEAQRVLLAWQKNMSSVMGRSFERAIGFNMEQNQIWIDTRINLNPMLADQNNVAQSLNYLIRVFRDKNVAHAIVFSRTFLATTITIMNESSSRLSNSQVQYPSICWEGFVSLQQASISAPLEWNEIRNQTKEFSHSVDIFNCVWRILVIFKFFLLHLLQKKYPHLLLSLFDQSLLKDVLNPLLIVGSIQQRQVLNADDLFLFRGREIEQRANATIFALDKLKTLLLQFLIIPKSRLENLPAQQRQYLEKQNQVKESLCNSLCPGKDILNDLVSTEIRSLMVLFARKILQTKFKELDEPGDDSGEHQLLNKYTSFFGNKLLKVLAPDEEKPLQTPKVKSLVSEAAKNISTLILRTVDDVKGALNISGHSVASAFTFSLRQVIEIYITETPLYYEADMSKDMRLVLVFYNDCSLLVKTCSGIDFSQGLLSKALTSASIQVKTKRDQILDQYLEKERKNISAFLYNATDNNLLGRSDTPVIQESIHSCLKKAFECSRKLVTECSGYLSHEVSCHIIYNLVTDYLHHIVEAIIRLPEISTSCCDRLGIILGDVVGDCKALLEVIQFTENPVPPQLAAAWERQILRAKYLQMLLDMRMVDILDAHRNRKFNGLITQQELSSLVNAIFEDSPVKFSVLEELATDHSSKNDQNHEATSSRSADHSKNQRNWTRDTTIPLASNLGNASQIQSNFQLGGSKRNDWDWPPDGKTPGDKMTYRSEMQSTDILTSAYDDKDNDWDWPEDTHGPKGTRHETLPRNTAWNKTPKRAEGKNDISDDNEDENWNW